MADQEDFAYAELLPLLRDQYSTTTFRKLTADGVSTVDGPGGRTFL